MLKEIVLASVGIFIKDLRPSSYTLWMQVRKSGDVLDGLHEFPGGKIEKGELPIDALTREIYEEVSIPPQKILQECTPSLFKIYSFPHSSVENKTILMHLFLLFPSSSLCDFLDEKGIWYTLSYDHKDLKKLEGIIPKTNFSILRDLSSYLGQQKSEFYA